MALSDVEIADRVTRRRARAAMVLGAAFIATQGSRMEGDLTRDVDFVNLAAWALWIGAFTIFLAFGGGLFRSRSVRNLVNDESSDRNRRDALACGFWAMLATGVFCYGLSFFDDFSVRKALQVTVTVGIGATMINFGARERRAHAE